MNSAELVMKDFITELAILLRDAKRKADLGDPFDLGRKMSLYEALSLLKDQATAFGISFESLTDVDPDKLI